MRFRKLLPVALPVGLAAIIVAAGKVLFPVPRVAVVSPALDVATNEPGTTEVVFVLIASSNCAAMRNAQVRDAVLAARDSVRLIASRIGARAVTVGVAVDVDQASGLSMLESIGPWDEVTVGRNWLNGAVIRYVWRDMPGPGAVPQVLFLHRTLKRVADGIRVGEDKLLLRLVGGEEVISWLREGGVTSIERLLNPG